MLAVLVVDDELAVRDNLAAYLEDEGMRVGQAESGEEAVELVKGDRSFEICIMDMRLPGMDGNTCILALHTLQPDLRFLVHTGSANYSPPPALRDIGVSDNRCL